MQYEVTEKVVTNSTWESDEKFKNIFTEGRTFGLNIKECVGVLKAES